MMNSGIIVVDKPTGMRSTACVERIRTAFPKGTKVGHAGTLDSTASGMLIMLIGKGTRLAELCMGFKKTYVARIQLGWARATDDYSGDITAVGDTSGVTDEAIRRLLPAFLGWRMQTPPSVSAVHVKGVRAHKIARAGGEVDIQPRPVYIENLTLLSALGDASLGDGCFTLRVVCSRGTYIRSLARDIGLALGCFGYIDALRRTACGPFNLDDPESVYFENRDGQPSEAVHKMRPLSCIAGAMPLYRPGEGQDELCRNGACVGLDKLVPVSYGQIWDHAAVCHGGGFSVYRTGVQTPECTVNIILEDER